MNTNQNTKPITMTFSELCRRAAHNLHERMEIKKAMREGCSEIRREYLVGQLRELGKEKAFLVRKHDRIKQHNGRDGQGRYIFII